MSVAINLVSLPTIHGELYCIYCKWQNIVYRSWTDPQLFQTILCNDFCKFTTNSNAVNCILVGKISCSCRHQTLPIVFWKVWPARLGIGLALTQLTDDANKVIIASANEDNIDLPSSKLEGINGG